MTNKKDKSYWEKVTPNNYAASFFSGVNFIKVLCSSFLYKSFLSSFSLLRVWLWRNFHMKNSARKMLMKLSPVLNVINILWAAFALIFLHQKIPSQTVTREKLHKNFCTKKMYVKLLNFFFFVFWFLLFNLSVLLHLEKKSLIVKWPSLAAKKGEILCYQRKTVL